MQDLARHRALAFVAPTGRGIYARAKEEAEGRVNRTQLRTVRYLGAHSGPLGRCVLVAPHKLDADAVGDVATLDLQRQHSAKPTEGVPKIHAQYWQAQAE
jgi:hypothetical protein